MDYIKFTIIILVEDLTPFSPSCKYGGVHEWLCGGAIIGETLKSNDFRRFRMTRRHFTVYNTRMRPRNPRV